MRYDYQTGEHRSRKGHRIEFFGKHWKGILATIGIGAVAAIGALLVFLQVVEDMQAAGLVPTVLGQWSVGVCVIFVLNLLFWEILYVGIPAAVVAIVIYTQWWRYFPKDKWPRRGFSKGKDGEWFSFLITIAWLILVWLTGRWNLAFQNWTLNDWIYSWLTALVWVLIIFGIPAVLGGTLWLRHKLKE